MKILGLDLSLLSTGTCLLMGDPGTPPEVLTSLIPQPSAKGVKEGIERLCAICRGVLEIVEKHRPDHVVIEAPAKNQKWQMAAIGEIHGTIKMQLFLSYGIVPVVEQANKMRSYVVGKIGGKFEKTTDDKGRQKKKISYGTVPGKRGKQRQATVKDVVEIRLKEQGYTFATQDEMDAYVAARYLWNSVA